MKLLYLNEGKLIQENWREEVIVYSSLHHPTTVESFVERTIDSI
jgi:hypothetical protein